MLLRNLHIPASLALVAGLFGGCGVGSGIFGPETFTVNIPASLDGYTTSAADVILTSVNGIAVGDNGANDGRRGHVRFNLASIPAGADIQSAELRLAQADITGTPYTNLGNVRVDHMNLGLALDAGDHFGAPLLFDIGPLSIDGVLTVKTLDVTARVIADRAALRTTSDYRLRFSVGTDSDGFVDTAHFEDMENSQLTGQIPLLVIVYK